MDAGANFASSPGRININTDPAILSEKWHHRQKILCNSRRVSSIIISGSAMPE